MAVSKPSWLRGFLAKCNFDVLVWKLYIGDWIESAIDWALGWINWGIDQANNAYNWAQQALARANEVWRELTSTIYREAGALWNRAFAWWSELGDWFEAKRPTIEGWINFFTTPLRTLIDVAQGAINKLSTAWTNFRTQTLPKLLDTQWITDFFGKGISNFNDLWGTKVEWIKRLLFGETEPIKKEVNKQASWWDMIKWLLTDPLEWKEHVVRSVFSLLERILARLW